MSISEGTGEPQPLPEVRAVRFQGRDAGVILGKIEAWYYSFPRPPSICVIEFEVFPDDETATVYYEEI